MDFKRFVLDKLYLFFMLTTLITVAVYVLGSVYDPGASFGYGAFMSPIVYAACCVIPTFVTYSEREMKPRELLGRMAIELILIEAVVLFISFRSRAIDTDKSSVVLALVGSVLVIYVLAALISWLKDSAEAKKLNADLLEFQQLHGE